MQDDQSLLFIYKMSMQRETVHLAPTSTAYSDRLSNSILFVNGALHFYILRFLTFLANLHWIFLILQMVLLRPGSAMCSDPAV